MKHDEIIQLEKDHIMQTYKRAPVVFEHGKGCELWDTSSKRYLDFIGGVATCTIGHANKQVVDALSEQAKKLISVSNLYYTEPQVRLAHKLSELSGLLRVFFCHSGAEANEAAIKLAKRITGKTKFIAFQDAFHGRTAGSLALTWKPEFKQPFGPLSTDVVFAEYGNAGGARALIDDQTAAVIVEPIQGEAGIVVPPKDFLKQLRDICDEVGILMIVDEVQTGVGRTGSFFAYEAEKITPDIVTLAKGLANGVPIGVCLSNLNFEPGDHGSTLGGNSLSCAAALATIDYIEKHHLMNNATAIGEYLLSSPGARGKGLMIGLECANATKVASKALDLGLLCSAPTDNVIRFLPPLIVSRQQVDEALSILTEAKKLCTT